MESEENQRERTADVGIGSQQLSCSGCFLGGDPRGQFL